MRHFFGTLLALLLLSAAPAQEDLNITNFVSYGGSQDEGIGNAITDTIIELYDNAWKAVVLPEPYTITENTVVRIRVETVTEAEIVGFALVNSLGSIDHSKSFQIHGTQTWGIQAYRTTENPAVLTIPVGQYYTGTATHLALICDDDGSTYSNARFSSIRIYDWPPIDVFLVPADAAILVAKANNELDTITSGVVGHIQTHTNNCLSPDNAVNNYAMDVTVADSIRESVTNLNNLTMRPQFAWSDISIVGRDALLNLADALDAAADAGQSYYDGASAVGAIQSALNTMNEMYLLNAEG